MPSEDQAFNGHRYVIIPRTLIFLFNTEGDVLLLKGDKAKRLWPGLYNGIGGHVEPGEDLLSAAERELFEEAGIDGVFLYLCGQIMVYVEDRTGVGVFIFKGKFDEMPFRSSSEGVLEWISMTKLSDYPLVEDLKIILPLVANHHLGESLLIGKSAYNEHDDLEISFRV